MWPSGAITWAHSLTSTLPFIPLRNEIPYKGEECVGTCSQGLSHGFDHTKSGRTKKISALWRTITLTQDKPTQERNVSERTLLQDHHQRTPGPPEPEHPGGVSAQATPHFVSGGGIAL